jgi:hypothetical protein
MNSIPEPNWRLAASRTKERRPNTIDLPSDFGSVAPKPASVRRPNPIDEPSALGQRVPSDKTLPVTPRGSTAPKPTHDLKAVRSNERSIDIAPRIDSPTNSRPLQVAVAVQDKTIEAQQTAVATRPLPLPTAALKVIDTVMAELSGTTDDRVRASKSELLVLLAKDFCDVVTFMGESSALYQHHMSKAAENGRIVAGHERDHLVIDQDRDILAATHDAKKRAQVAREYIKAIEAESQYSAAEARAADNELSNDVGAVRQRMIARQTVLDAALGNVKVTDTNYYNAFARLLYDFYADRLGQEAALEKTTIVLATRMNEDDFTKATGSEFYDLFIERRAAAARDKLHAQNTAAKDRELSHAETLARLKTDEERHKSQRMQTLKDLVGDGDDYDATI